MLWRMNAISAGNMLVNEFLQVYFYTATTLHDDGGEGTRQQEKADRSVLSTPS